jgi:hypothetical protein
MAFSSDWPKNSAETAKAWKNVLCQGAETPSTVLYQGRERASRVAVPAGLDLRDVPDALLPAAFLFHPAGNSTSSCKNFAA